VLSSRGAESGLPGEHHDLAIAGYNWRGLEASRTLSIEQALIARFDSGWN
jgi:hypothetical protein